ncbi:MAG: DMT family transporter [Bacillota bacterium]|jgi:drug/metabolite transporter (DMT)-like permease
MKLKDSFHFYALLTIIFWASAFVMTKIAMEHLSSGVLAFARYFFAFAAMLIFVLLYKIPLPKKEDLLWFFLSGLLGFSFYTIIFNKGTAMVTSATSSLIIATVPVITALLAAMVYKEKLKAYQWVAIFIEFAGIAVLTLWKGVLSINFGVFWLLLAAFSFSWYNLCQRRLLKKYPALQCTAYSMFAALLLLLPYGPQSVSQLSAVDFKVIAAVLVLALFCSALAYICWAKALGMAEKTTYVTNYMFITPLLAAVWGFVLIGEVPDFGTVAGGLIIFCGILIFNKDGIGDILHKKNPV